MVPDELVSLPKSDFSMVGGDFLQVYSSKANKQAWDAIVTCFFIDTGPNILDTLQIIHSCLKVGGLWINLGPLLYHFEDSVTDASIELSAEQIKKASEKLGFEFLVFFVVMLEG